VAEKAGYSSSVRSTH